MRTRRIGWVKEADIGGMEWAEIRLGSGLFFSRGVAIGTVPLPYRLDYELHTDERLATVLLSVAAEGDGWRRRLRLRRSRDDHWSIDAAASGEPGMAPPGGAPDALTGALDCDLGLSPVTNSMPVLRHGLHHFGSVEFLMAWVSVPDLSVVPSRQRYTWLGEREGSVVIRYSSDSFVAELSFDGDGLVLDYPRLARRLPVRHAR